MVTSTDGSPGLQTEDADKKNEKIAEMAHSAASLCDVEESKMDVLIHLGLRTCVARDGLIAS